MKLIQVLLIEDNRMDVELATYAFKEAGVSGGIHVASNGKSAIDYLLGKEKFANRLEYPLPEVILLDLKMPGMDGFDILKKIKTTSGINRIPVVILTSSKEEGDVATAYDLGANSFLVKPASFEGLIEICRKIKEYWLGQNIKPPLDNEKEF
jgi:CheY-like chemotaxis protein